jgi:hypothetical protein
VTEQAFDVVRFGGGAVRTTRVGVGQDRVFRLKPVTLKVGEKEVKETRRTDREVEYNELPLQQGWNKLSIVVDGDRGEFEAELRCNNKPEFLQTVRASLKPQE